jgi:N-acyl-D-aspartate/D-glutamate deacylase
VADSSITGTGAREIDATGHIVTPGWVDIHTHCDGRPTWDPLPKPSQASVAPPSCSALGALPDPEEWQRMLAAMAVVHASGAEVLAQVPVRSVWTMAGFATKFNPFAHGPTWPTLGSLPLAEISSRIVTDPNLRATLLAEAESTRHIWQARKLAESRMFPLVRWGRGSRLRTNRVGCCDRCSDRLHGLRSHRRRERYVVGSG